MQPHATLLANAPWRRNNRTCAAELKGSSPLLVQSPRPMVRTVLPNSVTVGNGVHQLARTPTADFRAVAAVPAVIASPGGATRSLQEPGVVGYPAAQAPTAALTPIQKFRAATGALMFCHVARPVACVQYPPGMGWTPIAGQTPVLFRRTSPPADLPAGALMRRGSSKDMAAGTSAYPPGLGYTPLATGTATAQPFGLPAASRTATRELAVPSLPEEGDAIPERPQLLRRESTKLLEEGIIVREMFLFYKEAPNCDGVGLTAEEAGFELPCPGWIRMEEKGDLLPENDVDDVYAGRRNDAREHEYAERQKGKAKAVANHNINGRNQKWSQQVVKQQPIKQQNWHGQPQQPQPQYWQMPGQSVQHWPQKQLQPRNR